MLGLDKGEWPRILAGRPGCTEVPPGNCDATSIAGGLRLEISAQPVRWFRRRRGIGEDHARTRVENDAEYGAAWRENAEVSVAPGRSIVRARRAHAHAPAGRSARLGRIAPPVAGRH